eukprot:756071-Hanusia_phi.AAC.8
MRLRHAQLPEQVLGLRRRYKKPTRYDCEYDKIFLKVQNISSIFTTGRIFEELTAVSCYFFIVCLSCSETILEASRNGHLPGFHRVIRSQR